MQIDTVAACIIALLKIQLGSKLYDVQLMIVYTYLKVRMIYICTFIFTNTEMKGTEMKCPLYMTYHATFTAEQLWLAAQTASFLVLNT